MNDPSALVAGGDFFGMNLGYDAIGNITAWNYGYGQRTATVSNPLAMTAGQPYAYGFRYDNLNRLLSASLVQNRVEVFKLGGTGGANNDQMVYDENGNILSLHRTMSGVSDLTSYSYGPGSNRLASLNNSSAGLGFAKSGSYGYDRAGNMVSDGGKGISAIAYNHLNLPNTISRGSNTISYLYSASGQKLSATFPASGTSVAKTYDYLGGMVWANEGLEFISTAEGRVLPPGSISAGNGVSNGYYRYEYQLKDHLGNLRVACRCGEKAGAVGPGDGLAPVVVQQVQYDP